MRLLFCTVRYYEITVSFQEITMVKTQRPLNINIYQYCLLDGMQFHKKKT